MSRDHTAMCRAYVDKFDRVHFDCQNAYIAVCTGLPSGGCAEFEP